jgi:hypothetical protein
MPPLIRALGVVGHWLQVHEGVGRKREREEVEAFLVSIARADGGVVLSAGQRAAKTCIDKFKSDQEERQREDAAKAKVEAAPPKLSASELAFFESIRTEGGVRQGQRQGGATPSTFERACQEFLDQFIGDQDGGQRQAEAEATFTSWERTLMNFFGPGAGPGAAGGGGGADPR